MRSIVINRMNACSRVIIAKSGIVFSWYYDHTLHTPPTCLHEGADNESFLSYLWYGCDEYKAIGSYY